MVPNADLRGGVDFHGPLFTPSPLTDTVILEWRADLRDFDDGACLRGKAQPLRPAPCGARPYRCRPRGSSRARTGRLTRLRKRMPRVGPNP